MDWLTLPPLAALRAFAALAETGGYSRAGEALNVSHAAVSQQIRSLEDRLGAQLVRREGRGAVLTPEGQRLAAALETAFGGIRRAIDDVTGGDPTRPLQISTTHAFAANWLMPRLIDFRREHPEARLMLNPTAEVVTLSPGGVDLAVRFGAGRWPGLAAELLMETSHVIVAAPSLVGDRVFERPADIAGLPWIQEYGLDEIGAWLTRLGADIPRPEVITHLPGHLELEALRAGGGVGPAVRVLVEDDVAAGRLRILFEEYRPGTGYYIVTRPGVMRPPLKAFVGWLRRQKPREAALPTAV